MIDPITLTLLTLNGALIAGSGLLHLTDPTRPRKPGKHLQNLKQAVTNTKNKTKPVKTKNRKTNDIKISTHPLRNARTYQQPNPALNELKNHVTKRKPENNHAETTTLETKTTNSNVKENTPLEIIANEEIPNVLGTEILKAEVDTTPLETTRKIEPTAIKRPESDGLEISKLNRRLTSLTTRINTVELRLSEKIDKLEKDEDSFRLELLEKLNAFRMEVNEKLDTHAIEFSGRMQDYASTASIKALNHLLTRVDEKATQSLNEVKTLENKLEELEKQHVKLRKTKLIAEQNKDEIDSLDDNLNNLKRKLEGKTINAEKP